MEESEPLMDLERATVVVADDHASIRDAVRMQLSLLVDVDVVAEAENGREAVDLIISLAPTVAVLDVRMPLLDGFGICEQITDAGVATRVVLFSQVRDPMLVEQGFKSGAMAFVCKDSHLSIVSDAVQAVRDGKRYVDPSLAAALIDADRLDLSPREFEILQLLGSGLQNDAIALKLGISMETVKSHVSKIMVKLDATSRTQAVAHAFRRSLLG